MDNQFTKERINCVKGQWKRKLWRGRVMNAATLVSNIIFDNLKQGESKRFDVRLNGFAITAKTEKTWTRLLEVFGISRMIQDSKERKDRKNVEKVQSFRTFQKKRLSDVKGNQALFEMCSKYVDNREEISNNWRGLYLWGNVWSGKTHTATAIANELIERHFVTTMFVSVGDVAARVKKHSTVTRKKKTRHFGTIWKSWNSCPWWSRNGKTNRSIERTIISCYQSQIWKQKARNHYKQSIAWRPFKVALPASRKPSWRNVSRRKIQRRRQKKITSSAILIRLFILLYTAKNVNY